MREDRQRREFAVLRQATGSAVAVTGLALSGGGALSFPPLLHPSALETWWEAAGPLVGSLAVLRLAGVVAGSYWLLLVGAVALTSRTGRPGSGAALRLPGSARLVRVALGGSLAATTMVAGAGCTTSTQPALHRSAGLSATVTPPELEPLQSATPTEPPSPQPPSPQPPSQAPPVPARVTSTLDWTVRPGDDLWSIARSVLEGRIGRKPLDSETAALWHRVIDYNRATLPDPDNPNLIFAGDVIAVPE